MLLSFTHVCLTHPRRPVPGFIRSLEVASPEYNRVDLRSRVRRLQELHYYSCNFRPCSCKNARSGRPPPSMVRLCHLRHSVFLATHSSYLVRLPSYGSSQFLTHSSLLSPPPNYFDSRALSAQSSLRAILALRRHDIKSKESHSGVRNKNFLCPCYEQAS